jgi:hypothetical protein
MKSPKGQKQGLLWARRGAGSEGWLGWRRWTREGCEGRAGGGRSVLGGEHQGPGLPLYLSISAVQQGSSPGAVSRTVALPVLVSRELVLGD